MKLFNHKPASFLIAVALSVGILGCSGVADTPEAVVEGFYSSLSDGNVDKSLTLLSPQTFGKDGSGKPFIRMMLETEKIRFAGCGGIKSVKAELKGDAEKMDGVVNITFSGKCNPQRSRARARSVDGKWMVFL